MTRARALAGVAALAAILRPTTARAADAPPARPAETDPLVFLFQGDAVVDSSVSHPVASDDPSSGSHLRFRRLRVGEDVGRGPWRLRAVLEASNPDEPFAPMEGQRIPLAGFVRLIEAFGAFRPHRAFEVDVGAQRVPFSLSRQVDEIDLRLPERAQPVVALAPDFRTAVAVKSDLGLFDIRVAGASADRDLDAHLFSSGFFGALRLGTDPVGPMGVAPWRRSTDDPWYEWWRFSLGVSALYGTLLAPRTLGLGGDAQLQVRRFTMTGEYLAQRLDAGGGSWPQGAVLEPGVLLVDRRLELVLRGSWTRAPTATATFTGTADTLAAGGALTFFARDAHLRVQAGLELRHTLDDRLPESGWAIIRASLAL
jgi:hypothetical protein